MKVLFFSPFAHIWSHSFPEAILADALTRSGHEVLVIHCNGTLKPLCLPLRSLRIDLQSNEETRKRVCNNCQKKSKLLSKGLRIKTRYISDFISPQIIDDADVFAKKFTLDQFTEGKEHLGIKITRLAAYELLIESKRLDFNFNESEWKRYQVDLKNAYVSLEAVAKIFDEFQPDVFLGYNTLYGVISVANKFMETKGVPTYCVQASANLDARLESVLIAKGNSILISENLRFNWTKNHKYLSIEAQEIEKIIRNMQTYVMGSNPFLYRNNQIETKSAIEKLGIPRNSKVILVGLSSQDEYVALESLNLQLKQTPEVFSDHVEWVKFILDIAPQFKDCTFVIRVHPREFPNHREKVLSDHAKILLQILTKLPSNVVVNWPSDGLTMMDWAMDADVFLASWSSIGKELSHFGIPVISHTPDILLYPEELIIPVRNRHEYSQILKETLNSCELDPLKVVYAFRWSAYEGIKACLNLQQNFRHNENNLNNFQKKLLLILSSKLNLPLKEYIQAIWPRKEIPGFEQFIEMLKNGDNSLVETKYKNITVNDKLPNNKSIKSELILIKRHFQPLMTTLKRQYPNRFIHSNLNLRLQKLFENIS